MKRLILINLLLVISLNILPKEVKVEQVEIKVEQKIASRSLEQPRIQIEEPIPTDISEEGIEFIKQFEGCITKAKKLKGENYYTIGFGHTGADVKEGQTITEEQANRLLKADLKGYTESVLEHCNYLDLNQAQLDSLVSFTYNCGFGNLKKLTANGTRTEKEIAEHITSYTKSSSEINRKGLAKRRLAEQELFLGGV